MIKKRHVLKKYKNMFTKKYKTACSDDIIQKTECSEDIIQKTACSEDIIQKTECSEEIIQKNGMF